MGYAEKPENNFSSRFCRREKLLRPLAHDLHGEGTDCSWGKLNSISDFLQEIVVTRAVPAYPLYPKQFALIRDRK
jgi:hypothetical protein